MIDNHPLEAVNRGGGNCALGEHRATFLIDAAGPSQALGAVPPGFLRSATTVTQVDQVYKYAGLSG